MSAAAARPLGRLEIWQLKVSTYRALGLMNIGRVAWYRLAKRAGLYRRITPGGAILVGPILQAVPGDWRGSEGDNGRDDAACRGKVHQPSCGAVNRAGAATGMSNALAASVQYFSCHTIEFPTGPEWFRNPWRAPQQSSVDARHWSQISDFSPDIGDIKTVWELSRFDWAPKWAWRIRQCVDARDHPPLEAWVRHWCQSNPLNIGPNWKCGQETALRALNLLLAARILKAPYVEPTEGLLDFLRAHLHRIQPSIRYAIGQDNNHGTSEAAALLVIGEYLARHAATSAERAGAQRSAAVGRRWLENRARRLIMLDGSFSQYSVTYHRLMLDTLSLVELFRNELGVSPFSREYYQRVASAVDWLAAIVDPVSGDAPNLGANDGAYVFNLDESAYRDFRPSVILGCRVFDRSLPEGVQDRARPPLLQLFDATPDTPSSPGSPSSPDTPSSPGSPSSPDSPDSPSSPDTPDSPGSGKLAAGSVGDTAKPRTALPVQSTVTADTPPRTLPTTLFEQGGYARLIHGELRAWLRLPAFRFRPSQCDALHLDLWCRGVNLLRDGGSYSYNPDEAGVTEFFNGTASHNTVRFDGRDQMPKISHFLIGGWLQPEIVEADPQHLRVRSAYVDHWGARHERDVMMGEGPNLIRVRDSVAGFEHNAELRWRLLPGRWELDKNAGRLNGVAADLSWQAPPGTRAELIEEPESRHYLERTMVPVLRLTLCQPGDVLTDIAIKPDGALLTGASPGPEA